VRVFNIATKQGHWVPDKAYYQQGPFDVGILATNAVEMPEEIVEEGYEKYPEGATVNNGMQGPRVFQCVDCEEFVLEPRLDDHECGDGSGESIE